MKTTHYRTVIVIVAAAAACHHQQATQPAKPRLAVGIEAVSEDTLRAIAARDAAAGRTDPMLRANEVARLARRITATPDSIVLRVGEPVFLHSVVQFIAYDSSGAVLPGLIPWLDIADKSIARFTRGNITALRAGTTELSISPMVFDPAQPRPDVRAIVRLMIIP